MPHPTFRVFAQHYLAALLEESGTLYLDEMIPRNPNLRTYKHPSRNDPGIGILRELIGNSNRVWISPEIIAEAEVVDLVFEPDAARDLEEISAEADISTLGWLGELIDRPTIIQVFRHLPTTWDMRDCLRHWLCWWAEEAGTIVQVDAPPKADEFEDEDKFEDEDETEDDTEEAEEPLNQAMLVLMPSIMPALLEGYRVSPAPEYQSGVYRFPPAYAITLVVINQLPNQPDTLLLRLLGRGIVQRQAIEELAKMDHPFRGSSGVAPCAKRIIQQFQAWHRILQSGEAGRESQKLMQTLSQLDSL